MVSLQLPHGSLDYASNLLAPRQPDVSVGSTPAVCNRVFDLESWSEPPRIPAMPSVDHANGASCQEGTRALQ